jgi:hypothetical protein
VIFSVGCDKRREYQSGVPAQRVVERCDNAEQPETARAGTPRSQFASLVTPYGKLIIERAYRLALSRSPGQDELATGREFLDNPQGLFSERLADFCLVLFNLDEFLYVE